MSDKPKTKFKWVEKLKNIKHIEIYIILIFAIVLMLIFFSSTGSNNKSKSLNYSNSSTNTNQQTTITTYVSDMETKLEQILSQVQGASNVNVMITLDMSSTLIKEDTIETTAFPKVKGIVIVAKGVENTAVKMNILKAVQAVIDISSGRIEILSSN